MTKITQLTATNIDPIQADIKAALAAVEEKYGVTIGFGGIRYDSAQYGSKMTVTIGNADEAAKAEFDKYCWKFNLKPSAFGSTFTTQGQTFTVVGIKPKGKKYPVLAKNAAGKVFKFPERAVDAAHRNGTAFDNMR